MEDINMPDLLGRGFGALLRGVKGGARKHLTALTVVRGHGWMGILAGWADGRIVLGGETVQFKNRQGLGSVKWSETVSASTHLHTFRYTTTNISGAHLSIGS